MNFLNMYPMAKLRREGMRNAWLSEYSLNRKVGISGTSRRSP
jgi:hypothetical protein